MRLQIVLLVAAGGCCALAMPAAATASLILSFDNSSYTIVGVNGTIDVPVFVSQVPSGPQVGAGNELLTSGISLSYNNPGNVAEVVNNADVMAGSAWDSSSGAASATTATLAETSLAGIADFTSPLLLATFRFTGESVGTTTISLSNLTPSPSFITAQSNVLDPANSPTATIHVVAVPEPSTLVAVCVGLAICGAARIRRLLIVP